jgi:hypothetical protein
MAENKVEDSGLTHKIHEQLLRLVSHIPLSREGKVTSPHQRAKVIARTAALKAAAYSAGLALPPGPLGFFTILPDLKIIWGIQQQVVVDIAACYGKSASVTREVMIYCLFRHAAAMLVRDLVVRVGERLLVRRVALRTIQALLGRIGIRLTQKIIGSTVSRWIPFVGAAGIGAYSYFDTQAVAKTAMEFFAGDVQIQDDETHELPALHDESKEDDPTANKVGSKRPSQTES